MEKLSLHMNMIKVKPIHNSKFHTKDIRSNYKHIKSCTLLFFLKWPKLAHNFPPILTLTKMREIFHLPIFRVLAGQSFFFKVTEAVFKKGVRILS